jgi:hypothetical protein
LIFAKYYFDFAPLSKSFATGMREEALFLWHMVLWFQWFHILGRLLRQVKIGAPFYLIFLPWWHALYANGPLFNDKLNKYLIFLCTLIASDRTVSRSVIVDP